MTETIATTPEPKASGNDQRWTQAETFRFDTYEEAKAKFDTLTAERKRIRRRRASPHFDVVVYAPLRKAKPVSEPVAETEAATVTDKPKKQRKGKRRGASDQESLG